MTSQTSTLEKYEPYSGKGSVIVGNGDSLRISHIYTNKLAEYINLLDVLVMPHITKNILSITKLTFDYAIDIVFSDTFFTIQNRTTKRNLAQGRYDRGLYVLDRGTPALVAACQTKGLNTSYSLRHLCLGHVPFLVISHLKLGHLNVTSILSDPTVCSSC